MTGSKQWKNYLLKAELLLVPILSNSGQKSICATCLGTRLNLLFTPFLNAVCCLSISHLSCFAKKRVCPSCRSTSTTSMWNLRELFQGKVACAGVFCPSTG